MRCRMAAMPRNDIMYRIHGLTNCVITNDKKEKDRQRCININVQDDNVSYYILC